MSKLTIIDLQNHHGIFIKDTDYVYINQGQVECINSKNLDIDINQKKGFKRKFIFKIKKFFLKKKKRDR